MKLKNKVLDVVSGKSENSDLTNFLEVNLGKTVNQADLTDSLWVVIREVSHKGDALEEFAERISDLIHILVENGADLTVREQTDFGNTMLITAVICCNKWLAKTLIEEAGCGAEKNRESLYMQDTAETVAYNSPLMLMCKQGSVWNNIALELLNQLEKLDLTEKLDVQNHEGNTALIWASIYNLDPVVKKLLEMGAERGIENIYGFSAKDYYYATELKCRRIEFDSNTSCHIRQADHYSYHDGVGDAQYFYSPEEKNLNHFKETKKQSAHEKIFQDSDSKFNYIVEARIEYLRFLSFLTDAASKSNVNLQKSSPLIFLQINQLPKIDFDKYKKLAKIFSTASEKLGKNQEVNAVLEEVKTSLHEENLSVFVTLSCLDVMSKNVEKYAEGLYFLFGSKQPEELYQECRKADMLQKVKEALGDIKFDIDDVKGEKTLSEVLQNVERMVAKNLSYIENMQNQRRGVKSKNSLFKKVDKSEAQRVEKENNSLLELH